MVASVRFLVVYSRHNGRSFEREFKSVQDLIDSGKNVGEAAQLFGDFSAWWKESVVQFPDKCCSSAAMVEVHGKRVIVGTPFRNTAWTFGSCVKALRWAGEVNQRWLSSSLSSDEFIADLEKSEFYS